MRKSRHSDKQKRQIVDGIESYRQSLSSYKAALAAWAKSVAPDLKVSLATFHRYRRDLGDVYPAVQRNWIELVGSFEPNRILKRRFSVKRWKHWRRRLPDDLRQMFSRPSRPHRSVAHLELQRLHNSLARTAEALDSLSLIARDFLEVAVHEPRGQEASLVSLLERATTLAPDLLALCDELKSAPGTQAGTYGPSPDERASGFVMIMATLYCDLTGRKPTYTVTVAGTQQRDDGVPDSEFIRFVGYAHRHFLTGTFLQDRLLHWEIQQCCARLDWPNPLESL